MGECVGGLYYILNCNFTATHTNYFIHTEYERDSLNLAWKKLEAIMPNNIMAKLKLFVDVIGLYRQIYVAKDLTSRVRWLHCRRRTNLVYRTHM
jgi:hypothetical protein